MLLELFSFSFSNSSDGNNIIHSLIVDRNDYNHIYGYNDKIF